ncbi:hypothetical protein CK203_063343 [Vitis vinifera]|uniref:Uncharacterized protein n=1 Tax=Vitis vinifera TaxID=29760 RepID=A0A438FPF6_VITVI|nr:hypothetical protein CK203_063343 [Vitis vinifera]
MPRWGIPLSLSSSDHLQIPSLLDLLLDLHRASPYCHCLYVWGIPPLSFFVWGIPPLSFPFGASSHCHFVWGIPPLSFRLGHPPTVILFRASPYCYLRLGHPPIFSLFRAFPYLRRSESSSSLLSFGVQSHHRFSDRHSESHPRFRHSELLSLLSLTFRVIITTSLSFGIQSHHRFSYRHSESPPRFRRSESLSLLSLTFRIIITTSLSFGIQSHHRFSDRHSESPPRFRRSESLSLLSLTFRVIIITSQFRRSELSSVFRSTFRVASSVSAFRVVITSQFDVQSHHNHFLVSAFRAIIGFQIDIQSRILGFDVQSRYHFSSRCFLVWCLESALSSRVTTPGVHIHWLCASCLHGFALSLGFSSLRYPVFIVYSSRSPHRVVPFGRILARTPGWFDNYSSLTLISWVAFRDILEGVWVLDAALEMGMVYGDGLCRKTQNRGRKLERERKEVLGGGASRRGSEESKSREEKTEDLSA